MPSAVEVVRSRTAFKPSIGVVLGSGLGAFADGIPGAASIPYAELTGFPKSTAIGHAGKFVVTREAAFMSGRFHLYEGYSPQQVVSGIRLFHALGVKRIILTNAAGAINPKFKRGEFVLLSDHINLQGTNPLIGPNEESVGPRFPDMTEAYSKRLRDIAREEGSEIGLPLQSGVYAAVSGPSFETPAEIRYMRTIGADLVGMSTAAEAIAARHAGMEVLGISCVTNAAAGLGQSRLDHQEVLDTGKAGAEKFSALLSRLIARFCAL